MTRTPDPMSYQNTDVVFEAQTEEISKLTSIEAKLRKELSIISAENKRLRVHRALQEDNKEEVKFI